MKNQLTSQNQLTKQFLRLLDRQQPSKPTLQSIMQLPANLYSIIKQMYNAFKKQNQSHILQNKIYDLKIHENKNKVIGKCTAVTIKMLCQSYNGSSDQQNINNLIILKSYLPPKLQKQLIMNITNQILKINNLTIFLKSFKKILKTKQCLTDKTLYKETQTQMMSKLLTFNSQFSSNQIKSICNFLLGLPYLDKQILEFIAQLFQKIPDISDFQDLKIIYTNIYHKLQNQTNNDRFKQTLLKSLMKITINEHIDKIKQLLQKIHQKIINKHTLSQSNTKFLLLLQKQAKNKITTDQKNKKQKMMDSEEPLKQKQKKIIDFIFLALQSQVLINTQNTTLTDKQKQIALKQSKKFWIYFMTWHQLCSYFPAWKDYIAQHILTLVHKLLQSPKTAIQVIKILIQTQIGSIDHPNKQPSTKFQDPPSNKISNQNQSISNYLIQQLLSDLTTYSHYLNNKSARKLIALCVIKDELQIYQNIIFNQNNLVYIDILLQLFQLPNISQYFKRILSDPTKKSLLQTYLITLLSQKPKKFKDFFIKIDSYNKGQIFQFQQYYLLKFFQQYISIELTIAFLRDMTGYSPSKYSIQIMNRFITKYIGKPEQKIIYYQAIRTLHIILSTRTAEQLPVQFKKHLKQIVASKVISPEEVFKNVPEKMTDQLTKFYNSEEAQ